MTKEEVIENIKNECFRIEEDAEVTSKSQYNTASILAYWHKVLGTIAALSSIIAGFSAIKTYEWGNVVIIIASFLSAALVAISSFLKPLEKSAVHHNYAADFQKLKDDTRIFRNTVLSQDGINPRELTDRLQELSDRRSELRKEAPQPFHRAYKKAKKGIKKGESTYKIDSDKNNN